MQDHVSLLATIARQAMLDRGLAPDFSPAAEKQLASINAPAAVRDVRDLRNLSRCSIAYEVSRYLDQLSVVEDRGGVYRSRVRNRAQLAYDSVCMWLQGSAPPPEKVAHIPGLAENLKLQDRTADRMRELRQQNGALDLETIEARPVFSDGKLVDLRQDGRNNAKNLIEDLMIGANGATARSLAANGLPGLRRVVRSPERWDRIEKIASDLGERLPPEPDARAL